MIAPNFFQAQKAIALPATSVIRERRAFGQSWPLRLLTISATVWLLLSGSAAAGQHDELTIGITQFPATLNPNIDAMAAKSYVLGMTLRPFTVYDADWKLVCLLCTELPSIENGLRRAGRSAGRQERRRPHLYDPRRRDMGRRRAGHDRRRAVHLRGRPQPAERDQQRRALSPHHRHRREGRQDLHDACRQADLRLRRDQRFRRCCRRISSGRRSPIRRNTARAPATPPTRPSPGLYNGPYRISEIATGSHLLLEPNPHWAGPPAPFPAHHGAGDREHRRARGQSAVRHDRHDRGRARPVARRGARLREAARRARFA